jgi:hypothetical protein
MDIISGDKAYALPLKEGDVRIILFLVDSKEKSAILGFELPVNELKYSYLLDIYNATLERRVRKVDIIVQLENRSFRKETKLENGTTKIIFAIRMGIEQAFIDAHYKQEIQISNALKKAKDRCYPI